MRKYQLIGLMSGTSLDGLDLAHCHIAKEGAAWHFELGAVQSIAYSDDMRSKLEKSIFLSAEELLILHNTYGTWLGERAKAFCEAHDLSVDAIASHGHTTHHRPEEGLTFQIGSGQHLANASGHQVICDFRTNDVALGGQGAPLVPIGDHYFFGDYDFCLNLGGISNISFEQDGKRIAYDIGLANMILNHITQKVGLAYDEGGRMAASGQIHKGMLQALDDLEYYRLPSPKSTGYEWFTEKVVPIVEGTDDTIENLLHTAIVHNCQQIAQAVNKHRDKDRATLFVTGGGALNEFFIDTLRREVGGHIVISVPDKKLIEYKEALVFALMGTLRLEKEINVLHSVTGSQRDSSSGVIYWPA